MRKDLRKKLQIGICLLLVFVCVAGLIGIWNNQRIKRKELREQKKEEQSQESEWDEEHTIDWDAYFDEGGYFGDYGDEIINYPIEEVNGIDIQAEYATVHVKHSEEILDVEVYTQIGDSQDAISCEMKDGILTIIQANLDEDNGSDGSYIEVTLPSGKKLDSFKLMQKTGVTSLAMNGRIDNVVINMDSGMIMADALHGSSITVDINTTNIYAKSMDFEHAQFCVSEGVLRIDELNVDRRLEVYNTAGSVNATLVSELEKYSLEVLNQDGTVEIGDESYETVSPVENSDAVIILKTQTGNINLDILDETE